MSKNDKNQNLYDDGDDLLSEEELEILRATRPTLDRSTLPPHDNSDLAKAKRFAKKNKMITAIVVITISALLLVLLAVGCFALYRIITAPNTKDYEVIMGVGSSKEEFTIPYKSANIDGVFYFDMGKIQDYAELKASFSSENNLSVTYWAKDEKSYVRFENGKNTALIKSENESEPERVMLGGTAKITAPNEKSDGACLVPFTFVQKLFSYKDSIRFHLDGQENILQIRRKGDGSGTVQPISFSAEPLTPANDLMLDYYKELYPTAPEALFSRELALINKTHPLGEAYVPKGLVLLKDLGCPISWNEESSLTAPAAQMATMMLADMNKYLDSEEAVNAEVTSAYRDYAKQEELYDKYIQQAKDSGMTLDQAIEYVNRTSAQPGQSEHQSGLCIDIIEENGEELTEAFEQTDAFEWLSENAYKYGFILRYPKDKTKITQYSYEPWHYRFVGIEAASVIHNDGICLEEYLAKTTE